MKAALELQPCCGRRSGIGIYTYELACRLRSGDGLEFHGNLFNFCGRNDNSSALQGISMPVQECRSFPYGVYRRMWHMLPIPYSKLFSEHADLNLFFNYIVPPRVEGKVITTIHDLTYLRFPETVEARNLRRIERDILYSVERSSHIITISEFSKREIESLLHIPASQISVIYAAPSSFPEGEAFSKIQSRWKIRTPYLLYVGTIEPRKNLVRLLRAFDRLKRERKTSLQLVLAGAPGWKKEEIYRTAQEIASAEEVVFTGYISAAEKKTLYEHARVFVFPSLYEGFGIPPLEAMSLGCPVVCSNAASLPEVAGEAAELVDPLDEFSIAEGIWNVVSNQEYSDRLVQAGYAQAGRYTWTVSAERLRELCRSVLDLT